MGKMSAIFLIIIILYLLYAFIQSRQGKEKKENDSAQDGIFALKTAAEQNVENGYEKAAVAAVIAAIMGDAAYSIKRIYVTATVDEKKSSWKISGRNESMMRRVFFK
jgi:cbb3-type cytochrome oxidase subunit 3